MKHKDIERLKNRKLLQQEIKSIKKSEIQLYNINSKHEVH